MATVPAPAGRRYEGEPVDDYRRTSVIYVDPCDCVDARGAHVPRCRVPRPLPTDGVHGEGYAWGYAGSGPANLARSIVADVLGFPPPPALYQAFKTTRIAVLDPTCRWVITAVEVRRWALDLAARDPMLMGWRGCLCADSPRGKPGENGHLPGCPAHEGFREMLK